jgi:hypothetical protein
MPNIRRLDDRARQHVDPSSNRSLGGALSAKNIGSGGGTRTPDTRIMMQARVIDFVSFFGLLLHLCCNGSPFGGDA